MKCRLLTGSFSVLLLIAPLASAQEQVANAQEQVANAQEQAATEAKRQAQVALKPNAQSPQQNMQQAIAFEKYKELAAEREARKTPNADRSIETPRTEKTKK